MCHHSHQFHEVVRGMGVNVHWTILRGNGIDWGVKQSEIPQQMFAKNKQQTEQIIQELNGSHL